MGYGEVDIRQLAISSGIRIEVLKLLTVIESTESVQSLNVESYRAQGFVLGLETAVALKPDTIEALFVGFERAVKKRLEQIRHCD